MSEIVSKPFLSTGAYNPPQIGRTQATGQKTVRESHDMGCSQPTILDLVGLDYEKGGRGPLTYDCYGLCLEVCRRAGVVIPEIPTPTTRSDRNDLFCSTKEIWHKLSRPEAWCLAAFRIKRNWHAGVVLPSLTEFIHITAGIRVTISKLNNFKWRKRLDGFYVFPDN